MRNCRRVAYRINQRQRGAPTAAKSDELVDAQRLADRLDVFDKVPGGVGDDACMGP